MTLLVVVSTRGRWHLLASRCYVLGMVHENQWRLLFVTVLRLGHHSGKPLVLGGTADSGRSLSFLVVLQVLPDDKRAHVVVVSPWVPGLSVVQDTTDL